MSDWKLEIKKVNNGYVLRGNFSDLSEELSEEVIEIALKEDGELEAMQKILYSVKEYFGMYYSKHNKKNLVVDIKENKE